MCRTPYKNIPMHFSLTLVLLTEIEFAIINGIITRVIVFFLPIASGRMKKIMPKTNPTKYIEAKIPV
jgi:hypothetical protein